MIGGWIGRIAFKNKDLLNLYMILLRSIANQMSLIRWTLYMMLSQPMQIQRRIMNGQYHIKNWKLIISSEKIHIVTLQSFGVMKCFEIWMTIHICISLSVVTGKPTRGKKSPRIELKSFVKVSSASPESYYFSTLILTVFISISIEFGNTFSRAVLPNI